MNYRILRDNKEKGPYSLNELLQLNLKPQDLIWVEGKSAGWRYPSEIDSLKAHLSSANESPIANEIIEEAPVVTVQSIHPASLSSRPLANHQDNSAPSIFSNSASPANPDEELSADKLEKKASEIYLRVQAYNQKNESEQREVETKYARSLDDLKQEYADWLHQQKGQKKTWSGKGGKKMLVAAVLSVCLALVSLLLFLNKKTSSNQNAVLLANAQTIPPSNENTQAAVKNYILPGRTKANAVPQSKESSVDEFLDSVQNEIRKQDARLVKYNQSGSKRKEGTNSQATVKNTIPAPEINSTEIKESPQKRVSNISELVNMNARYEQASNKNISLLEVTISNNSMELLKTVTVDVFYYKKGERLFDKETLYFNNILPGNTLTVSRPGNKKASTARFQLGQISSIQN